MKAATKARGCMCFRPTKLENFGGLEGLGGKVLKRFSSRSSQSLFLRDFTDDVYFFFLLTDLYNSLLFFFIH